MGQTELQTDHIKDSATTNVFHHMTRDRINITLNKLAQTNTDLS